MNRELNKVETESLPYNVSIKKQAEDALTGWEKMTIDRYKNKIDYSENWGYSDDDTTPVIFWGNDEDIWKLEKLDRWSDVKYDAFPAEYINNLRNDAALSKAVKKLSYDSYGCEINDERKIRISEAIDFKQKLDQYDRPLSEEDRINAWLGWFAKGKSETITINKAISEGKDTRHAAWGRFLWDHDVYRESFLKILKEDDPLKYKKHEHKKDIEYMLCGWFACAVCAIAGFGMGVDAAKTGQI